MQFKKTVLLGVFLIGVVMIPISIEAKAKRSSKMSLHKEMVHSLLKSLETGDAKPIAYINNQKYTQHNLGIEDGIEGLGKVLSLAPKGSIKVNTIRLIEDGNFVVAHTDYNFFGPKIGFDVFRFENGKIVEHWDNLEEKMPPNLSQRTQIDGETMISDLDKTAQNKALVAEFVNEVLLKNQYSKMKNYINNEHYAQHNPHLPDGLKGLQDGIEAMLKNGIQMEYKKVHRVLGEGNFVLVISEGYFNKIHSAYYDLFRIQDGKICEHWDVIETIPNRSEWKNQNGKF